MPSETLAQAYKLLLANTLDTRKMLESNDLSEIDLLLSEHQGIMEKIRNIDEEPNTELADLIRKVINEIGITQNLMLSLKTDMGRELNSQYNRNKINRAYGS